MERLSDLDRKILALLQRDGRRSFADIGREVGLSTPAVKRRVDRLEAAGVIRGYAAVVDASKLGLGFEAIAEVYCADRTAPQDVLASVVGIPEVVSAVTVSGEPDAVLRVPAAMPVIVASSGSRASAPPPRERASSSTWRCESGSIHGLR